MIMKPQELAIAIDTAKAVLFAYLAERHPDVARIVVRYSGSGDEGYVDEIIGFGSLDADAEKTEFNDEHLKNLIDEVFCHVTPDGFENNEGGDGEIHIYPAIQKMIVHHYENVIHQEHETYEA
jgi:hypothetical protein